MADSGICDDCHHAYEAHGDDGCRLCECADEKDRATGVPPGEGQDVTLGVPSV